jgi:hypothetical protein
MGRGENFSLGCFAWSITSFFVQLSQSTPILNVDNCASFNQAEISQSTDAAHSSAAQQLLNQGTFARVVDGYAQLHTNVAVGNLTGGGTNTNGRKFHFISPPLPF